jgi:DNA-binding transcriptional MerR regulator
MKMEKRKFRIGELAHNLQVERFVIRFWEKEFTIKGERSSGGQRFYSENDLKKFQAIKELLYEKKFTIAGARQMLHEQFSPKKTLKGIQASQQDIIASHVTTLDEHIKKTIALVPEPVMQQLLQLKEQLISLKSLL